MNTAKIIKENKALRKTIDKHMIAMSDEVESLAFDTKLFHHILLNDAVECVVFRLEGKERDDAVNWINSIVATALELK